jgi:hypothetical protein
LRAITTNRLAGGGEADLLSVTIHGSEQNTMLIQRFQQQAEQEYQEFLGQYQDFHQELDKEREKRI